MNLDYDTVKGLYEVGGFSQRDIAIRYGVSQATVSGFMKKTGIRCIVWNDRAVNPKPCTRCGTADEEKFSKKSSGEWKKRCDPCIKCWHRDTKQDRVDGKHPIWEWGYMKYPQRLSHDVPGTEENRREILIR